MQAFERTLGRSCSRLIDPTTVGQTVRASGHIRILRALVPPAQSSARDSSERRTFGA